jgi:outer membrane receptor protein involved in Fe transport
MRNLPATTWGTSATFTTEVTPADGRVHGADARMEYRRGPFYGFAGYGYGWTEYETAQESFGEWFGEPIQSYHPAHDRRHQANALASFDIAGFTVAARWELGSGFPYTQPLGFDEYFDFRESLPSVRDSYGPTRVLLDRPYNERLPSVHRLDLSAERTFDVRARKLQLQAGVLNAYDRKNIFYYDVFTGRRIDQLPFAPYAALRLLPR